MSQKYAQCDSNGKIIAYYDDRIHSENHIGEAVKISDDEWMESLHNPGKYIIKNGKLIQAPPKSKDEVRAQQWMEYQSRASAALAETDGMMLEVAELMFIAGSEEGSGNVFSIKHAEFVKWRIAMREIIRGDAPKIIPEELPACPLVT